MFEDEQVLVAGNDRIDLAGERGGEHDIVLGIAADGLRQRRAARGHAARGQVLFCNMVKPITQFIYPLVYIIAKRLC